MEMKYNVSFYNDLVELLTERKANFVNQMKALSSKVVNAIGKKVGGTENTTGKSIVKFLSQMVEQGTEYKDITITLDGWNNPEFEDFPNSGKPIPVKITFINRTFKPRGECNFNAEGSCHMQKLRGQVLISGISVKMTFSLSPDYFDGQRAFSSIVKEFQRILVHEIAHGYDKLGHNEWETNKKVNTSHSYLKYLHYWIKPTEIRSHMNEMIHFIKSEQHITPKRTFRNMYRDSDKAREHGIEFTDEHKSRQKQAYSIMNKRHNSKSIDEKSHEALTRVLNNAWVSGCPKSLKTFIIDYHIAFVRDSSPTMKERYYDKYFPNTDVPSLDKMNSAYEAIQTIYRTLIRLENDINKRYRYDRLYDSGDLYREAIQDYYDFEEKIFDIEPLSSAIMEHDYKKIKKATKQVIEQYRDEKGYMTKGMMTKQAKKMFSSDD